MPFIELRGCRFHYQRFGQPSHRPPIVYLHGLIMDNLSSAYFTFAHRLSEEGEVILFDLRGHGASAITSTGYKVKELVDDLIELLDHLELQRSVHLVGCSFGGLLALATARDYPNRVSSIALIDGHLEKVSFLQQLTKDLTSKGAERTALISHHFQHWLHRDRPRKRAKLEKRAQKLIFDTTLIQDLSMAHNQDEDLAWLSRINHPVLALYGAASDALEVGQLISNYIPECKLTIFKKATHAILWEATDEVIEALHLYFRQVSQ